MTQDKAAPQNQVQSDPKFWDLVMAYAQGVDNEGQTLQDFVNCWGAARYIAGYDKRKAEEKESAKAAPQAAGAVSIDSPESRLKLYRFDVLDQRGTALAEGIGVHCHSMHEAEEKARKMLEGGESAIRFKSNAPCHPARKCAICSARPDLAGATAFANDGQEPDWKAHEAAERATTAPAMGEELPPLTMSVYGTRTALELERERRACIAPRQPGAGSRKEMDIWNAGTEALATPAAPVSQPAMPDLRSVIHWLEGGCDPIQAAKELRLYQKQIGQEPAPVIEVSQPAAQKQKPVGEVAARGRFTSNIEWYSGLMPPVGTKLYTAPSPLSAPAGSEQEGGAA